jgi:hypothetical protein
MCWLFVILECNFACGSVWVWSSVTDIKGGERLWVFENRVLRSWTEEG